MITPNASQDYFVIYHYDDSDGHWIDIKREYLSRELTNEEFSDRFVEKILKPAYPEAHYFDVYFRDSDNEEFTKKYEV